MLILVLCRYPDAYYIYYNLTGLSAVQYYYVYNLEKELEFEASLLSAAFKQAITEDIEEKNKVWDKADKVKLIYLVFIVLLGKAEAIRRYFKEKARF